MKDVSSRTLYGQVLDLIKLLKSKKRWIHGALARTKNGNATRPTDPKACQFCLVGGIQKVTNGEDLYFGPLGRLIANTIRGVERRTVLDDHALYGASDIYGYNDNATHEQVMEVLRTAAASMRGAIDAGVGV